LYILILLFASICPHRLQGKDIDLQFVIKITYAENYLRKCEEYIFFNFYISDNIPVSGTTTDTEELLQNHMASLRRNPQDSHTQMSKPHGSIRVKPSVY